MPRGDGVIREISWPDICPWLILVRGLKVAIGLRMLLLAAIALWLISAGWWAAGKAFSGREEPLLRSWIATQTIWPWEEAELAAGHLMQSPIEPTYAFAPWGGPYLNIWAKFSAPFVHLFDPRISLSGMAYSLLCCLWALLVLGLFGGAISRIAALALTREESIGWRPAVTHAWTKLGSYIMGPLLPIAAVLVGILVLSFFALLMRLDFGVLLAGILWPLVLLAGLLMTIILVGVLFGWPLMWPTLAVENSDSFESMNRAYAYVYQRPLRYIGYLLIATALAIIGAVLVNMFTGLVIHFSELAVTWGAGYERVQAIHGWSIGGESEGNMAAVGATLIRFWNHCARTLGYGFQLSYFFVASTGIYLLLRRSVDAIELDEVYLDDEQAYGLPSLEKNAAGVPGVPENRSPADLDATKNPDSATDVAGDE